MYYGSRRMLSRRSSIRWSPSSSHVYSSNAMKSLHLEKELDEEKRLLRRRVRECTH